jgi:ApbE superfamily uncharacterized protein (UPF0280 family)
MTGRERARIRLLPDGRLHLNDGPIDLIIAASGEPSEVKAAYAEAASRFVEILDELCSELPLLRAKAGKDGQLPVGPVARRMMAAVQPFAEEVFITPMAAVAGSVAEEMLAAITSAATLSRLSVNNGGDIAIHLGEGESYCVGMVSDISSCLGGEPLSGSFRIASEDSSRGVATSGWPGRSFSLGIADAVTVLARSASMADAAATVVANAVDLPGHPAAVRAPACDLAPDSDLGSLLVTRHVGELSSEEISLALARGFAVARKCQARGLIAAAVLSLQGAARILQPEASHRWEVSLPPPSYGQDREASYA